ncbi:unnamed protein product [Mytilus edulis]|uniref:Uncharacterized protein n=1 Tax=Mytilus edulis TaxID=6550 RepID=A0A8S3QEF7_MYTED|nr:unnamed protein product [Mytilus edulis]
MQDLTGVAYWTSDQHKEANRARKERDRVDTLAILEYLSERNHFTNYVSLRNIETGVKAEPDVNNKRHHFAEHQFQLIYDLQNLNGTFHVKQFKQTTSSNIYLINVLCDKLQDDNIKCNNVTDDEDLLIVQTALDCALSLVVIVNGENTDLLVLLFQHVNKQCKQVIFKSDKMAMNKKNKNMEHRTV